MRWCCVFYTFILMLPSYSLKGIKSVVERRVIVAGATGYIGRSVVRELLAQGIPTAALVRSFDMPEKTVQCLRGATIIQCDVLDPESTKDAYSKFMPTSTICCLASRSGVKLDAWAVDYGGGLNLLQAQELIASTLYSQQQEQGADCNFVLLSAFCVGKPLLQFQFAKLKLEDRIRQSPTLSHSIVRPTAFFKSLDGQVETVRKGLPVLYFGDGTCAANAICERDLARYLIDCVLRAKEVGMVNSSRDIGGPDVPPITKREQIELIYDTLDVPQEKRLAVSLPIEIFDVLIFLFSQLEGFFQSVNAPSLKQRFEDAAEIARIVRYYATEPMVAVGPGEVHGVSKLADHFRRIAERGGKLEEVDKMTTTTGVLELFTKNQYTQKVELK